MNRNNFDEIINGENTYKEIANRLMKDDSVLIGWTDEEYTHFDIFFKYQTTHVLKNTFQRGIKASDLFVGIVDHTFYGFKIDNTKHWSYIAEKLRLGDNDCTRKVAELINGVIKELGGNNE